jgi:hypothetical protein
MIPKMIPAGTYGAVAHQTSYGRSTIQMPQRVCRALICAQKVAYDVHVCGPPFLSTRRGRTVPRLAQIRPHSTYTKHQLPLLYQYNIRCTIGLVIVTLHHPGGTTKILPRKVNGKEIARIYDERK